MRRCDHAIARSRGTGGPAERRAMIVAPLASGSGGNCFLFESGSTRILLDAGLGIRQSEKRLHAVGRSLASITAMVISHEHSDHVHGAERIARKFGIPVYMTAGTRDALSIDPEEVRIEIFANDTEIEIGELTVRPRRTLHDAADSACFVIESADGTRVGIASDLGHADARVIAHLQRCNGLFFEANHDLDMLRSGTYPWSLKRRIMSRHGHLSNDDSMAAIQRMLSTETTTLCLIHLSEKNNHESIVRSMATELVERSGAQVDVHVARQHEPIGIFAFARSAPAVPPPARPAQMLLF
jgi:phosphoribosyl 1,2-cyclic phosphodiesterase